MVDDLVATVPGWAEFGTQDTHQVSSGILRLAGNEMVVYPDKHARPPLTHEH